MIRTNDNDVDHTAAKYVKTGHKSGVMLAVAGYFKSKQHKKGIKYRTGQRKAIVGDAGRQGEFI